MPREPSSILVRAVDGRMLPAIDPAGRQIPGRFVGYARNGKPLASVSVPSDPYHTRALARGDLALAPEPPPPEPAAPEASSEPLSAEPTEPAAPSAPAQE